ncbi:unnamed protein product [Jaminaea pallidilutea]
MSQSPPTGEEFLVIGGNGFLGHNLASALLNRGETKIHILDVRPPTGAQTLNKVQYHTGDITDLAQLSKIVAQISPQVIFHTASPAAASDDGKPAKELMEKVNVTGTSNVVEACKAASARKLVFTSSASVVFTGEDLIFGDERLPLPEKIFDTYSETKARAEAIVLDANTPDGDKGSVPDSGLRTVSIRPAGIFGPNDRQALPGFYGQLLSGRTNFQFGENANLFDWTYVDNVSHAHLLAADRLETPGYDVRKLSILHLPAVRGQDEQSRERTVPTSEERPSVSGAKDYARDLPSTLSATSREETLNIRPVIRNKYDEFFHYVHTDVPSPGSPIPEVPLGEVDFIPVAGEAFFVTNGQPMPFWDFPRALWREASPKYRASGGKPWAISRDIGLFLGGCAETVGKMTGYKSKLSKFTVTFSCTTRYYNIEKARRILSYEPLVGMDEAIKRSAQWWLTTPDGQALQAQESGKKVAVSS